MQQEFCSNGVTKTFVEAVFMSAADILTDAEAAREWIVQERAKRGWSTTKLADVARNIARREGSSIGLTQQSVSGFEQPGRDGKNKRVPQWLPYVKMAFEEGEAPVAQDVQRRDELAYVRQVDIRYAMGDGATLDEYPDVTLVPFNLGFINQLTRAPLERLFLATGHGDSMEPTLLKNDLILIDTSETSLRMGDQIWALEYAGAGYIKRLRRVRREGQDRILILSDNERVPAEEAHPEDVHIVGKVVWIGRQM